MTQKVIKNPVKVIREHCLDCSNGSFNEVKLCTVTNCFLFPWRFGKNPYRKKREISDEQKTQLAKRLKNGRE